MGELVRHVAVGRPGTVGFPSRTLFRSLFLVFPVRSIMVLLPVLLLHGMGCQPAAPPRSGPISTLNTAKSDQRMLPGEESEADDFGEDWDVVEHLGGRPGRPAGSTGSVGLDLSTQTREESHRLRHRSGQFRINGAWHGGGSVSRSPVDSGAHAASGLRTCTVAEFARGLRRLFRLADPEARDDLKRLRDLTVNGQQLFSTAMLTEIKPARDPASIGEDELLWVGAISGYSVLTPWKWRSGVILKAAS